MTGRRSRHGRRLEVALVSPLTPTRLKMPTRRSLLLDAAWAGEPTTTAVRQPATTADPAPRPAMTRRNRIDISLCPRCPRAGCCSGGVSEAQDDALRFNPNLSLQP